MRGLFVVSSVLHAWILSRIIDEYEECDILLANISVEMFTRIVPAGYVDIHTKLQDIGDYNFLGLANRFAPFEVSVVDKLHGVRLVLYEEGLNFYLDAPYFNRNLADWGFRRFLNQVKLALGRGSRFVHITAFAEVRSVKRPNYLRTLNTWKPILLNKTQMQDGGKKTAMLLDQWFVKEGFISENEWISILQSIYFELSKSYAKVYYKAHPRQLDIRSKAKRIGFEIIHSDLPVEMIIENKDLVLFGFWTSALYYGKLLGISTYSLLDKSSYPESLVNCLEDSKVYELLNELEIEKYKIQFK